MISLYNPWLYVLKGDAGGCFAAGEEVAWEQWPLNLPGQDRIIKGFIGVM